jgi:hypothetical protein
VSVYDAHRRYRRAGWRFSVMAAMAVVALGLPLSVIVSPFASALGLMALDAVNLIVPMPDPGADIGRFIIRFLLIGFLLVCGVMLLGLLASMIYLALLLQMLLLLPPVAGVRFVLRDLVASA